MSISIGVDIGGTFTDVVSVDTDSSRLLHTKVSSTPPDLVRGFIHGIDQALGLTSAPYGEVSRIVHGTTVGTNAILEAKGAPIGILVTDGFEDVLTIGRQKRSDMYDVFITAETPIFLAPRRRIFGIQERLYHDGTIDVGLNEEQVAQAVKTLVDEHDVQAIAVCYLFSFANPEHEHRTRDLILDEHPDLRVSLSSDLDPRFREYERLCLTAFDAYLRPVMERYLGQVQTQLAERGADTRFHVMHSRGGVTSDEAILSNTVSTVLSGPAAGVVGGIHAARLSGIEDSITLDMGGTSCDVALVEKGKPILSSEGKIAKYPLRQPMLDINTIGAGGGSIAWLDAGGALRVGPRSAGAVPGPACYDAGGQEPTVTDASLVLGYLNPDYFAGGAKTLSRPLAERAIERAIAGSLGMSVPEAAQGIHTIVNSNMADEVRLVSVNRGYDPRNFALVPVGGAGPVHAGRLAQQTHINRVLVPRNPGVQSAFGLLVANLEHERARTFRTRGTEVNADDLARAFRELEQVCQAQMDRDKLEHEPVSTRRSMEFRYVGQSYELEIPFTAGQIDAESVVLAIGSFHELHERVYGHRDADDLVEIVTLRVILSQSPPAMVEVDKTGEAQSGPTDPVSARKGVRSAYFTESNGYVDTPIYSREALKPGMAFEGPAIIEQEDTTTVVYPGHTARVDLNNIVVEIE